VSAVGGRQGAPRTRNGNVKIATVGEGCGGCSATREIATASGDREYERARERERERGREGGRKKKGGATAVRGRGQLKLAQFSHSPVIRGPGIYIIKSRKFLSPLHPHRRCVRVLAQPTPPSVSTATVPLPPCRGAPGELLPRAFRARFLGATERRIVATIIRRQGSNAGFRRELRLIALIATTSRLYYSLFNRAL